MTYSYYSISNKGKRAVNEDSVYPSIPDTKSDLFLVCDGLGGMAGGEIASKLTGLAVHQFLSEKKNKSREEVISSIKYANSLILNFSERFPKTKGMASTIAMLSRVNNIFFAAWVGDSRVYQIRKGEIVFQSKDHSYKQLLLDKGIIDDETDYNSHIITQAIGGKAPLMPSVEKIENVQSGDYFVLLTDGVLEAIPEEMLNSYFDGSRNNQEIVEDIISKCKSVAKDNFSLYVFKTIEE